MDPTNIQQWLIALGGWAIGLLTALIATEYNMWRTTKRLRIMLEHEIAINCARMQEFKQQELERLRPAMEHGHTSDLNMYAEIANYLRAWAPKARTKLSWQCTIWQEHQAMMPRVLGNKIHRVQQHYTKLDNILHWLTLMEHIDIQQPSLPWYKGILPWNAPAHLWHQLNAEFDDTITISL